MLAPSTYIKERISGDTGYNILATLFVNLKVSIKTHEFKSVLTLKYKLIVIVSDALMQRDYECGLNQLILR